MSWSSSTAAGRALMAKGQPEALGKSTGQDLAPSTCATPASLVSTGAASGGYTGVIFTYTEFTYPPIESKVL